MDSNYSYLYKHLVSTLKMLSETGENVTEDDIADFLEELEGDYHTFLHPNNLLILKNSNFIDDDLTIRISHLRSLVKKTDSEEFDLWNIEGFKKSEEWLNIHRLATEILIKLK